MFKLLCSSAPPPYVHLILNNSQASLVPRSLSWAWERGNSQAFPIFTAFVNTNKIRGRSGMRLIHRTATHTKIALYCPVYNVVYIKLHSSLHKLELLWGGQQYVYFVAPSEKETSRQLYWNISTADKSPPGGQQHMLILQHTNQTQLLISLTIMKQFHFLPHRKYYHKELRTHLGTICGSWRWSNFRGQLETSKCSYRLNRMTLVLIVHTLPRFQVPRMLYSRANLMRYFRIRVISFDWY